MKVKKKPFIHNISMIQVDKEKIKWNHLPDKFNNRGYPQVPNIYNWDQAKGKQENSISIFDYVSF